MNLTTAYENEAGLIVVNRKIVALKYIFSWFLLDLVACIPFDIINTNNNRISLLNTTSISSGGPNGVGHIYIVKQI